MVPLAGVSDRLRASAFFRPCPGASQRDLPVSVVGRDFLSTPPCGA